MVCLGKLNYVGVMAVTETTVRVKETRGATAEELVVKMYKQYCISDGGNNEANDYNAKEMSFSTNSNIECYHCGQK